MKRRYFALGILAVVLILLINPLINTWKILLFVSEEFPQIGVKPLKQFTPPSLHEEVVLDPKLRTDMFTPPGDHKKPALILALGVRTAKKDRPMILDLAESLSRLGYVVIWPRLTELDEEKLNFEEPETFIKAFEYLEVLEGVNPKRISMVGISAGSSVAFVAATDSRIRDKLRGLVFFGGYYDIFDYLESLVTNKSSLGNETIEWRPAEGLLGHTKDILTNKNFKGVLKALEAKTGEEFRALLGKAPPEELDALKKISPSENLTAFKTKIFILHDKSDAYVPYLEATKMNSQLPREVPRIYALVSLFNHVQPKGGLSPEILGEFTKLFFFLQEVMGYL